MRRRACGQHGAVGREVLPSRQLYICRTSPMISFSITRIASPPTTAEFVQISGQSASSNLVLPSVQQMAKMNSMNASR